MILVATSTFEVVFYWPGFGVAYDSVLGRALHLLAAQVAMADT
jgi:hypothetical protein